jgi:hypothetical protein
MFSLAQPQRPHRAGRAELVAFVFVYLDLLSRYQDALDQKRSPRHEPLPFHYFRENGIGELVLRWMLFQGHVEHLTLAERTPGGKTRAILVESVILTEASCFALTETGAAFADHFLAELFTEEENGVEAARERLLLGQLVPAFNQQKRVLSWGCHILKCFRQPSPNQELLLSAAEEMAWPKWFDDPLPPVPQIRSPVRLHDAIKALNNHQTPYLVHFKGDGTGTRVGWEYRPPSDP